MKKTITWLLLAAAILIIYIVAAKTLVLPWIGDRVAALLVGTIGLVSGLFLRKKRSV